MDKQAAREKMEQSLESVRRDFATVRTGKASGALLDNVKVEAYGSQMPVNQVGTVSVPEPRTITIQPWDRSQINAIMRAIQMSDLGLTPTSDGAIIRISVPPLTEERRREFVKTLGKYAEEGRVAMRQIRKDANESIRAGAKKQGLSEDDVRRQQDAIQKLTDEYVGKVDDLLKRKEAEVMEV